MDAFPAFFPLAGRTVVIAGAGEAADAKARLFEGSPARLVRLEGEAAFLSGSYRDASLVFVASADPKFADAAVRAARAAGAPVNVVDRPDACDFTTPAIIDRGEVVCAIGTGGAAPMVATLLRQDLEARLPPGLGRIARLLRELQAQIRARFPVLHERRAFIRSQLAGVAARTALDGDMEAARERLLAELVTFAPSQGRVWYVRAAGPVELLTLRAVQVLASADVVCIDAGCDGGVLDLARRDAVRLTGQEVSCERIIELARQGLIVVRLVPAHADPDELAALAQAGIAHEQAPAAAA